VLATFLAGTVQAKKPVVAVFEIKNEANLNKGFLEKMREVIGAELTASGIFLVLPNSRIQTALKEKVAESYKDCYAQACQLEIGKRVAAEKTLATAVKQIGSQCIVTMQLFDLRKSASENAGTAKSGCDEGMVAKSIYHSIEQLSAQTRTTQSSKRSREIISSPRAGDKNWSPDIRNQKIIVTFESEPPGAAVKLDGKLLCPVTPCKRNIRSGVRQVEMNKDQYSRKSERLSLTSSTEVNFRLEPTFGTLSVESEPANMPVYLDGKRVDSLPIRNLRLQPGQYKISVGDECNHTEFRKIEIEPGIAREEYFEIREQTVAYEIQTFDYSGNPENVNIFVDGVKVGETPGTFSLNICAKEMVLQDKDGQEWREKLSPGTNTVEKIQVTFPKYKEPPGPLIAGRYRRTSYTNRIAQPGCAHTRQREESMIQDTLTGLVWQANHATNLTWDGARIYCENLTWGELTDWRLPTAEQLESLINENRNQPASDFPDMSSRIFWSSTKKIRNSSHDSNSVLEAIAVYFGFKNVKAYFMNNEFDVRCVRKQASE